MSDTIPVKPNQTVSKKAATKPAAAKSTERAAKEAREAEVRAVYVAKIKEAWSGFEKAWGVTVQHLIATGQRLIDAKAELKHGQFGMMIKNELPFSPRTAQRLMQVASNPVLADPSYGTRLPTDTHSLAALSNGPQPKVRRLLETGKITPATTQNDVRALLGKPAKQKTVDMVATGTNEEGLHQFATAEDVTTSEDKDVARLKHLLKPRLGVAYLEKVVKRAAHERRDLIFFTASALRFYMDAVEKQEAEKLEQERAQPQK